MTTSGTVGETRINVSKILEHSLRRAGVTTTIATPDIIQSAKEVLFFYLSSLSNDGVNLWTIEKGVIGIQKNKNRYDTGIGTIDLKTVLRRSVALPSGGTAFSSAGGTAANAFDQDLDTFCQQTSVNGYILYEFATETAVSNVGFMPNGNQNYTLIWEYSYDGISWATLLSLQNANYQSNEWYYYDVDTPRDAKFYRVRETNNGILNVVEVIFSTVIQEINISRMNLDQYTNLTNKTFSSNIIQQFWFDRKYNNPQIVVWPSPSYAFDQIVVWKTRQIQDVGSLTDEIEAPQRWIDAIVKGMSARLHLELLKVDPARYDILKNESEQATYRAQQEERDKSPILITPNIGCYTS